MVSLLSATVSLIHVIGIFADEPFAGIVTDPDSGSKSGPEADPPTEYRTRSASVTGPVRLTTAFAGGSAPSLTTPEPLIAIVTRGSSSLSAIVTVALAGEPAR